MEPEYEIFPNFSDLETFRNVDSFTTTKIIVALLSDKANLFRCKSDYSRQDEAIE